MNQVMIEKERELAEQGVRESIINVRQMRNWKLKSKRNKTTKGGTSKIFCGGTTQASKSRSNDKDEKKKA